MVAQLFVLHFFFGRGGRRGKKQHEAQREGKLVEKTRLPNFDITCHSSSSLHAALLLFMHMVHHIIIFPRVFVLPPPPSPPFPSSAEASLSLSMLCCFRETTFLFPHTKALMRLLTINSLFYFVLLRFVRSCVVSRKAGAPKNVCERRGMEQRATKRRSTVLKKGRERCRGKQKQKKKSQTEGNAKHQKMRQLPGKEESGDN
jgi:hypothetical protein